MRRRNGTIRGGNRRASLLSMFDTAALEFIATSTNEALVCLNLALMFAANPCYVQSLVFL